MSVSSAVISSVPNSHKADAPQQLDWPGALTAAAGLAALTYGLTEASARGFGHPLVLCAIGVGVLVLAAFVMIEAKSRDPMMPLDVFRSRTFSAANLLTFLLYAALGGAFFFLPLNLIQVQGYSATAAGAADAHRPAREGGRCDPLCDAGPPPRLRVGLRHALGETRLLRKAAHAHGRTSHRRPERRSQVWKSSAGRAKRHG